MGEVDGICALLGYVLSERRGIQAGGKDGARRRTELARWDTVKRKDRPDARACSSHRIEKLAGKIATLPGAVECATVCGADGPEIAAPFRRSEHANGVGRARLVKTRSLIIGKEKQLVFNNGATEGSAEFIPAQQ